MLCLAQKAVYLLNGMKTERNVMNFCVYLQITACGCVATSFVADVHKTGRLFAVYGSELGAPDIICECLNMGVDILFSDNPPLAKSTVDAWKRERNNLCLY